MDHNSQYWMVSTGTIGYKFTFLGFCSKLTYLTFTYPKLLNSQFYILRIFALVVLRILFIGISEWWPGGNWNVYRVARGVEYGGATRGRGGRWSGGEGGRG